MITDSRSDGQAEISISPTLRFAGIRQEMIFMKHYAQTDFDHKHGQIIK